MEIEDLTTWLEIDLGAIKQNVSALKQITNGLVMAVVKANAYGHGVNEVVQAVQDGGADWCGVARIEEALSLRRRGIQIPILVLGYTSLQQIFQAIQEQIRITVFDAETARSYAVIAQNMNRRLKVHAKIDTGMGRLGVNPEEGLDFLRFLSNQEGLDVEGIFTHFARADEPDVSITENQIKLFQELIAKLENAGLKPPVVHAANTAGALFYPQARFDMVRSGVGIYGLHPSEVAPLPQGFRPALTWKARLISIKTLPANHGVSYGHRYVTNKAERVGVISVGYADGFRRRLGNYVLIHGKRVHVLGMVCMDQCMVQLNDIEDGRIGDEVVLVGEQGGVSITAEELAREWGTINYEVTCMISARVPRFYNEE